MFHPPSFWVYIQRKWNQYLDDMPVLHVHGTIMPSSLNIVEEWMNNIKKTENVDKETALGGRLSPLKMRQSLHLDNQNEPGKHCDSEKSQKRLEWNYDSTYIRNLKNWVDRHW